MPGWNDPAQDLTRPVFLIMYETMRRKSFETIQTSGGSLKDPSGSGTVFFPPGYQGAPRPGPPTLAGFDKTFK